MSVARTVRRRYNAGACIAASRVRTWALSLRGFRDADMTCEGWSVEVMALPARAMAA